MKRVLRYLLCAAASWLASGIATAETPAPGDFPHVTNVYTLGVGAARRADTYLTPLHYDGWKISPGYEHSLSMKSRPLDWILDVGLGFDRTLNPARNATMLGAQLTADWSLLRRWEIAGRFRISAGGAVSMDVGALYLSRNGNNPVAANASLTLGPAVSATALFRIGRLPVTASYRATLPVVGAMFTPDYGLLYYEIYMGDRRGLFGAAYWGRYFRLDQTIAADLKLGPHWLRIGYAPQILSTKVNGIVSHRINNLVIVGIRL